MMDKSLCFASTKVKEGHTHTLTYMRNEFVEDFVRKILEPKTFVIFVFYSIITYFIFVYITTVVGCLIN